MSDIQITFQDITVGSKAVKLITFVGQLDETNVDHEAKQVYQVITEMAEPALILDFSGLEYMNSKSIGYVTDWYTQVSGKNGTVSIVGPRPNILDILKVVGITQIVTIYSTIDEAKAALGDNATEAAPVAPAQPTQPAAPQAPAVQAPEAAPMSTPPQEAPEQSPEPAMQTAGSKADEPEAPTVPPVTPGV